MKKNNYFPSPYSEFVYLRTYARWLESKERRETWPETVDRYVNFMKENLGNKLDQDEYELVRGEILNLRVMPSMRLMQFAGKAARGTPAAYNCAFTAPTSWKGISEILYILMCGTGVGFLCSQENVDKLPVIEKQKRGYVTTYIVEDSKEGWADAFKYGLEMWARGRDVSFDLSLLRPAGSRLKTFGGFSSGPEPLRKLLSFARKTIIGAQGRKLKPLEIHDLICMIAEIVVCGGVRRSALISLSDLNDNEIRDCKQGQFWQKNPQRALSNNSAIYREKPSSAEFLKEFHALVSSGSGERGIFNQHSLLKSLPERRIKHLEDEGIITKGEVTGFLGTNPCAEIILKSKNGAGQFCNLSEIVCRPGDTEESLLKKIKVATLLGTYQSSLTKFDYLSKEWEENCKSERLLGVSLTGVMDCNAARSPETLVKLREEAVKCNEYYANRFGINRSTCITTVKPSGTVSQLVSCSSGLHGAFAPYYTRRVRITVNDPLLQMARDQGIPCYPEVGQNAQDATTWVLEFPVKASEGSIFQKDLSAIDQLELWKNLKLNYTEHNPSITCYVRENEWLQVANWVYDNFNIVGGISFLPHSDHIYELAPYEEISELEYQRRVKALSNFDISRLPEYEKTDTTDQKRELACVGNSCEI